MTLRIHFMDLTFRFAEIPTRALKTPRALVSRDITESFLNYLDIKSVTKHHRNLFSLWRQVQHSTKFSRTFLMIIGLWERNLLPSHSYCFSGVLKKSVSFSFSPLCFIDFFLMHHLNVCKKRIKKCIWQRMNFRGVADRRQLKGLTAVYYLLKKPFACLFYVVFIAEANSSKLVNIIANCLTIVSYCEYFVVLQKNPWTFHDLQKFTTNLFFLLKYSILFLSHYWMFSCVFKFKHLQFLSS